MKLTSTKSVGVDRLKILVFGPPGVGKTSLVKTITEPTLIISAEAGLLVLAGTNFDVIDITEDDEGTMLPPEKRIARLGEAYEYANSEEARKKYKWIFVDSITEISQCMVAGLQVEFPEARDSLRLYGENAKRMRALLKAFRDLPAYHVVFTALPHVDKDDNGRRFTGVSMVGKISDEIPAMVDLVFYLHVDDEGKRVLITQPTDKLIAKDRSGKLDAIEEANLGNIANKIKGVTHVRTNGIKLGSKRSEGTNEQLRADSIGSV
jgi:phage nucleotide-binding protein